MKLGPRKVIAVGNSLAVVLGNELCRLKRIDTNTKVKIHLEDDGRIVLEPLVGPKIPRTRSDRAYLFISLIKEHGFTGDHFNRLRHDNMEWMRFAGNLQNDFPVDPITIHRMAICLERRKELRRDRKEEAWSMTVDVAIALVPSAPASDSAA